MIGEPKYDLGQVQALVDAGRYWFSAPSRSLSEVIRVYRETALPKSQSEAEEFIRFGVEALEPKHFVGRTMQWGSEIADQYGIMLDGRPWFIKFLIGAEGDLEEISFHPPEKPLPIKSGEVIPAEDVS